jgi:hypothetical protein
MAFELRKMVDKSNHEPTGLFPKRNFFPHDSIHTPYLSGSTKNCYSIFQYATAHIIVIVINLNNLAAFRHQTAPAKVVIELIMHN